jgi:hypothetical protein
MLLMAIWLVLLWMLSERKRDRCRRSVSNTPWGAVGCEGRLKPSQADSYSTTPQQYWQQQQQAEDMSMLPHAQQSCLGDDHGCNNS